MFDHILTVCTGNICRSPLAAAMLSTKRNGNSARVAVRSAGISALVGHPAEDTVVKIAAECGLDLGAHRATQLDSELTRWAALILVMEQHHFDAVLAIDPTARGKTFLLGHWLSKEIADPYRQSEAVYRRAHEEIAEAVDSWIERL